METFELKPQNSREAEQGLREDFARLQDIAEVLREMGLRVIDSNVTIDRLKNPTSEMGFPIVRDGADGIRASYSKREGLKIWFTNGFENPANPRRQEAEAKLRKMGLV